MNGKGQVMLLGIMMWIFAFIVAIVLSAPIKDLTDTARDTDHLNCDADSISIGTSMGCVVVDLFLPFFIGTLIIGGGALITRGRV